MQASYPKCFCLVGANLLNSYVFPLTHDFPLASPWLSNCFLTTFQSPPNELSLHSHEFTFAFLWLSSCIPMQEFPLYICLRDFPLASPWLSNLTIMMFLLLHNEIPFSYPISQYCFFYKLLLKMWLSGYLYKLKKYYFGRGAWEPRSRSH